MTEKDLDELCDDYGYLSATTIEDAKKEIVELIKYSLIGDFK